MGRGLRVIHPGSRVTKEYTRITNNHTTSAPSETKTPTKEFESTPGKEDQGLLFSPPAILPELSARRTLVYEVPKVREVKAITSRRQQLRNQDKGGGRRNRRTEEEEDLHGGEEEGRGEGRVSKPQTPHPALVPKPEPSPLLSGGETVAPSGGARIGRAAKLPKARRPFGTTAPVPIPPHHQTPHEQGCAPPRKYSIQTQLWLCMRRKKGVAA